jgi:hypothetical protein
LAGIFFSFFQRFLMYRESRRNKPALVPEYDLLLLAASSAHDGLTSCGPKMAFVAATGLFEPEMHDEPLERARPGKARQARTGHTQTGTGRGADCEQA